MMKKLLALALVLTMGLTACGPLNGEGTSNGDWDGTTAKNCADPNLPPPAKVYGPKKGFVHILVIITADKYQPNPQGGRDICTPNLSLPFKIRLSGSLDRNPAFKLETGHPLPWTADLITPHFEHLYIPLTAKGRIWEVAVHAVFRQAEDASLLHRSYVRCAIFVDGVRASRGSARINIGLNTASCIASGPVS